MTHDVQDLVEQVILSLEIVETSMAESEISIETIAQAQMRIIKTHAVCARARKATRANDEVKT